jgi:hypothetical protein
MSDYIAATTHVDTVNHLLVFDSEGYYVVGDEQWQDIEFTATVTYNGGNIGIAPRIYDTNFYMFLSIHNENEDDLGTTQVGFANLSAQVTYQTQNIAQAKLAPLVLGQDYTFKVEIKGTNYRILLNDVAIFNIEYPGMSKGKVGVYSTAGNACKSIEVISLFADGWATSVNTVPGSIASIREEEDENKYLYLYAPTGSPTALYAEQYKDVAPNKPYTFSFNYKGEGRAKVMERNGTALIQYNYILPYSDVWVKEELTETISADCTTVTVSFLADAGDELMVNDVQYENKAFGTGYIHNESTTTSKVRESSFITYPSKDNINPDKGSLVMWFNPAIDYTLAAGLSPVLFEYGDTNPMRVHYDGATGSLKFQYGQAPVLSHITSLTRDTWYNITATWSQSKMEFYLGTTKVEQQGSFELPGSSSVIRIGQSTDATFDLFSGSIDETIILSNTISSDEVEMASQTVEPLTYSDSMIMRATFNYAIGNFNKSILEATLVPDYGSPVLVEKADGEPMRKVSFFDFYTGEYRTFNEELVQYDKDYDFVTISYHDVDVDQETFRITVTDAEGITYGEPLEMKGRKLYLALTPEEKDKLDGEYLHVTYQLEDSYTVDFNIGVPDSFRVTLGKHDGQPFKMIYEGNGFTDEKLLTMVELNPLLNPNHEGFLYVTRNDEKVTSFRTKATPEDLPANGGSEALIVVEPLDVNGNYIGHCKLEVTSDLGTVIPAYDEQSIKLRDRAGRFLYRYRSPILTLEQTSRVEVQDSVNVIDVETGIGVQIPITLTTLAERNYVIVKDDTLEQIAQRYGSTIEDIAYTPDMMAKTKEKYGEVSSGTTNVSVMVSRARKYISESVGVTIKIPINYSSRQLQENNTSLKHDSMIAYLTNMLVDYMNTPATNLPTGLGELLDFNGDGMINILEVSWLQDKRLTTVLQDKYEAVLAWDNAN